MSRAPDPRAADVRGVRQANPPNPTPLIDAKAAAALLSVPASWVLSEARANRIPHVKLGKYTRFEPAELEAWWISRRQGPSARTGVQPISRSSEAA